MRRPLIAQAIREKRVLRLRYDLKSRFVEPHAYGVSTDGGELLRAWQTSPLPADFRLFRLEKATGIALTDTHFARPRKDYEKGDKAMSRIFAEL